MTNIPLSVYPLTSIERNWSNYGGWSLPFQFIIYYFFIFHWMTSTYSWALKNSWIEFSFSLYGPSFPRESHSNAHTQHLQNDKVTKWLCHIVLSLSIWNNQFFFQMSKHVQHQNTLNNRFNGSLSLFLSSFCSFYFFEFCCIWHSVHCSLYCSMLSQKIINLSKASSMPSLHVLHLQLQSPNFWRLYFIFARRESQDPYVVWLLKSFHSLIFYLCKFAPKCYLFGSPY